VDNGVVTMRHCIALADVQHVPAVRAGRWLVSAAAVIMTAQVAAAEPQAPAAQPSSGGRSPDGYSPNYSGGDITRPENYFELRAFDTASGTTTPRDTQTLVLRRGGTVTLNDAWKAGWLASLPFRWREITTSNPGTANREAGTGDVFVQGTLVERLNERWAYGFGARLHAPTAEDSLGTGRWQIMPGAGVRYSFLEFGDNTFFVPKVRYAVSFAGDPSRRNISEVQFAPTLNIELPDHWFLRFYDLYDVRINFGAPVSGQTGRLFLPFDAAIGKKLTDDIVLMWEVSVPMIKDYPVYNFKADFRVRKEF
jgi:outer membrane putative beta-barrel porin/alpha-amylase